MTPNNNLSPFPWYDDISKQNHRRDYAFGNIFPLITQNNRLLPFQLRRDSRSASVTSVILRNIAGRQMYDITDAIKETGLTIRSFDGYDLIIYPGNIPMAISMRNGYYYAEMSDGVETWYSEVFDVVGQLDDFMKIEWWDEEPLYYSGGHIEYSKGTYKNKVYLCTQVGKPDYDFEEEGEERDGYFFPEKQVSEKIYKFVFIAPEYLCDAMRIIRMSDHVEITSRGETYVADSFLMTPSWQDQGDLAAVDVEFETDTVIKKIGIGRNSGADFNNDFNNDFNIE